MQAPASPSPYCICYLCIMDYAWIQSGADLIDDIRTADFGPRILPVWAIGQMGIVMKSGPSVIAVDPVLYDLADSKGNTRRNFPGPFKDPRDFHTDWVFCTHNHEDHLQARTLAALYARNPHIVCIVPAPWADLAAKIIPKENIIGAVQGEEIPAPFGTVMPIAAAHETYKYDGSHHSLCLGYAFHLSQGTVYHSGDTYLTDELVETVSGEKPDLGFLPINGIDWVRHQRGIEGNLSAREAAWLALQAKMGTVIPLHFDLVRGNGADPLEFARAMDELYPEGKFHILRLGERYLFAT